VRIAHKWKNASSERGREEARALFFFLLQPRCLDSRHPRVHERFELFAIFADCLKFGHHCRAVALHYNTDFYA
jgi:hypothetical protein